MEQTTSQSNSQTKMNRWVALLGVTGLALYLSWKVLEPFIEVLVLGIALTVVLYPLHCRIRKWTKGDVSAAALSTVFTILVIVVPFTFVATIITKQMPEAVEAAKTGVEHLRHKWDAAKDSDTALGWAKRTFHIDEELTPEKLGGYAKDLSQSAVKLAFGVLGGLVRFIVSFVFLLFVLFFLFRDAEKLGKKLIELLPLPETHSRALLHRTADVLNACVYGVLMVAAVQGSLGGLTFALLGISGAAIWGIVMMLFCTLPIVGAWVVWVPAAIGLALSEQYTKAIILALVGQFVISSIDGFLRPILVGQRAKLHELVIFFSVLGGLRYFGLLGILLGPVIMAITFGLLSVVMKTVPPVPKVGVPAPEA